MDYLCLFLLWYFLFLGCFYFIQIIFFFNNFVISLHQGFLYKKLIFCFKYLLQIWMFCFFSFLFIPLNNNGYNFSLFVYNSYYMFFWFLMFYIISVDGNDVLIFVWCEFKIKILSNDMHKILYHTEILNNDSQILINWGIKRKEQQSWIDQIKKNQRCIWQNK